jgi:uncharacterized protein (TIGR02588 family)
MMVDQRQQARSGRNAAEWVTLAVSIVILAAFLGAALYEHFLLDEPPGAILRVELQLGEAERRGDRFYVPFEVTNSGGEPASDVVLLFEVRQGEEVIEESDATIPFLPSDGVESGEVVLMSDPAEYEVTAQVGNYLAP